jgi:diguanylate cyclase (GGDEF)-like protein
MSQHPNARASMATLLDVTRNIVAPVPTPRLRVPDRGVLLQTSGAEAGRVHPVVPAGISLGRGDGATVRFDDATLSRFHAKVSRQGTSFVLEDLGALNGCFVNDQRVSRAILADGDRVRLGWGASFRFHILDEDEERGLVRMYESSVRDGLTGLFNRRHAEEQLSAEVSFAARHGAELSVVMLDIDHFKRVNDAYGHLAGDAVLRNVASVVARALRVEDMVARYGGEELVVVARGISVVQAAMLAERVRATVEAAEVPFEGVALRVTLSAGCASLVCCSAPTVVALLAAADACLYRAKETGRNRVIHAQPTWC